MTGISNLLLVFLGGGLGSLLRYSLSFIIKNTANGFPIPTFFVNVLGCLLIGFLFSFISDENQGVRLFLLVGILGGFTTFSTFGNESLQLFEKGQFQTGFLYIILSNICGLSAVYFGYKVAVLLK